MPRRDCTADWRDPLPAMSDSPEPCSSTSLPASERASTSAIGAGCSWERLFQIQEEIATKNAVDDQPEASTNGILTNGVKDGDDCVEMSSKTRQHSFSSKKCSQRSSKSAETETDAGTSSCARQPDSEKPEDDGANVVPSTEIQRVPLEGDQLQSPNRRHRNPYVTYKRLRCAISRAAQSVFKIDPSNDLQTELQKHQQHIDYLITNKVRGKFEVEVERIKLRDKISRERIMERFVEERNRLVTQYEAALVQLAEKMIAENEEERRQLEAELAAMGEGSEVPLNFNYLPARKQLRRRTHNQTAHTSSDHHVERPNENYVPIYQVHWINPEDIRDDLNLIDQVLQQKESPPLERHKSVQIHDGKLVIDGRTFARSITQTMIVRSQAFGQFPAMMLSLSEHCLTLRSVIKGDPRHITVTIQDLESGRVRISKK